MKKIAAVLCIALMLISSAALAKPSANERGNRDRTQRVREDKPKDRVRTGDRRNRRDHRYAAGKPRPRVQVREYKPKRKIRTNNHRNRRDRRYTYERPRRRVQQVRYGRRGGHRRNRSYWSPLFSLLHWSHCSCH